jgi:hypothetical protein
MENLIFSLNATVPVFLLIILGYVLNKLGFLDEILADKMNTFVFKITLPVLLFADLSTVEFNDSSGADMAKFIIFCFMATLVSISVSCVISFIWKDKSIRGEFIQASYRSSAALFGIAFIQNIYGNTGMAPMMIIGSVPLYNAAAVIVLTVMNPEQQGKKIDSALIKKTLKGIITNPIILGIIAGLGWALLKLPVPYILQKTVSSVGSISTPMGLMAMGAVFDFSKAAGRLKPAVTAAFLKLVGFCAVFLPAAVMLGFRNESLVASLVMLGSATTVSSYIMSKNMGHEGTLSSTTVMITTLCSSFTLTMWLFILKSMSLV